MDTKMDTSKAKEILGFIKQDTIPIGELDQLRAIKIGIDAIEFCQCFSPDQVPLISPNLQLYLSAKPPEHPFATVLILKQ